VPASEPVPARSHASGRRGRRRARRLAVDILYQADITGADGPEVLRSWEAAGRSIPDMTAHLVDGVLGSSEEIDALLTAHSEGWAVSRMSVVDRAILRVAVFELMDGVPAAIAINEAVEAAGELSTEASGRFVNGVLGAVARDLEAREPSG
jgi:transcription antitermination protein NusB